MEEKWERASHNVTFIEIDDNNDDDDATQEPERTVLTSESAVFQSESINISYSANILHHVVV